MEIIPEEWSVGLISPFLIGLSRNSLHTSRSTKLRKNLMRAENIKVRVSIGFLVVMMNLYLIEYVSYHTDEERLHILYS